MELASVLTVLRNRAYSGEIYYRGNWYPAPHELITHGAFRTGPTILTERGEDARNDDRIPPSTC